MRVKVAAHKYTASDCEKSRLAPGGCLTLRTWQPRPAGVYKIILVQKLNPLQSTDCATLTQLQIELVL